MESLEYSLKKREEVESIGGSKEEDEILEDGKLAVGSSFGQLSGGCE